jgi:hypothetical protein
MPFINETDRRTVLQEATPDINVPTPGFSETFSASVGLTIDENLSISQSLNREGWQDRQELIRKKIDEDALNRDDYMDRRGRFDYNRAATDLNDPQIKTDQVLEQERRDMLGRRRKYAEDVIERGNGMAQFLGMANAYMLDPISIATMPIALPATTAKSLSIVGRSLLAARNAAVIETATELAIQPFVYEHKQDIESPYTYKDALTNIAGAAIGASALGGVAGGVSGYLRKVRGEVESKGVITPEVESALENMARMQESIDYGRSQRATYDVVMADYDKLLQGEYDSFSKAAKNSVTELEKNIKAVEKEGQTIKQFIQDKGGMDRAIAEAEGVDPAAFKHQGGKPLFRKSGGRTPDEIAEGLNEINFRGGNLTANDVLDLVSNDLGKFINEDDSAKVDFFQRQIDELMSRDDEGYLESVYKGARENDIQADIDYLEALEVERELVKRPQVTPEQYAEPDRPKASKSSTPVARPPGEAVFFHGTTTKGIDNFDIEAEGGFRKFGKGVYLAKEEGSITTRFAKDDGEVLRVAVDGRLASQEDYNAARDLITPAEKSAGHNKEVAAIRQRLIDDGFSGFDAGSEVVVFESKNARIIKADVGEPVPNTSQRGEFILDETGMADDFNADMQRFNELENPRIIQDDEIVNAGEFMKSIDDELEGIDSVLTCAYG